MTSDTINDAMTMQPGAAGTLLAGRYRVVRQLGQGGMGSVWLAEDTQLDGKLFAIKMLPSILVSNKRAYRQLKDEALVAMKLTHPNIVTLRAFEENNGNPFLVMDYVDGETLDDYLAEHCGDVLTQRRREAEHGGGGAGGLPESEVIRLLKPIAAALDYAHSKGVVHRDVKPGNVMIARDGTPYILDFGIAREIQETMTRVTGKLSSGTLLYMSPEQLNGDAPTPAQDIYSFAAMAYECMKGEPPFVRGAIEDQIRNKDPEPLAASSVSLSRSIMSGLAKKPESRPSACVAALGASGLASGAGDAEARPRGRNRGAGRTAAVLAAVVALVLAGAWLASRDNPRPSAGADVGSGTNAPPREALPPSAPLPPEAPVVTDASNSLDRPPPVVVPLEPERISPVPAVDPGFSVATNRLAALLAERDKTYRESEGAISGARDSSRGFESRLETIDRTWSGRFSMKEMHGLEEAQAAIQAVSNEIAVVRENAAWICANVGIRDEAVEKETAFGKWLKEVRDGDGDLWSRAEKTEAWQDVLKKLSDARNDIGNGLFKESLRAFDDVKNRCKSVLDQARRQRDREKKEDVERRRLRAERELISRLDKEGFILDAKGNPRAPGTAKSIELRNGVWMDFVWCPPGWFMMGSPKTEMERIGEGETRHAVRLSRGFWIGKYEVTRAQWASVTGESIWLWRNRPQSAVSWYDCKNFIARLNAQFGVHARLPTEAEWEYACRAGSSTAFSFGSVLNGSQACCNGGEPYGTSVRGPANMSGPSDVGSFSAYANSWGINDMHGNVYEWCEDAFAGYPAAAGILEDPRNEGGELRVIRGGCWNYAPRQCRSAFRTSGNPSHGTDMIGFRLVCDDLP